MLWKDFKKHVSVVFCDDPFNQACRARGIWPFKDCLTKKSSKFINPAAFIRRNQVGENAYLAIAHLEDKFTRWLKKYFTLFFLWSKSRLMPRLLFISQ